MTCHNRPECLAAIRISGHKVPAGAGTNVLSHHSPNTVSNTRSPNCPRVLSNWAITIGIPFRILMQLVQLSLRGHIRLTIAKVSGRLGELCLQLLRREKLSTSQTLKCQLIQVGISRESLLHLHYQLGAKKLCFTLLLVIFWWEQQREFSSALHPAPS
jgi:hypothetical protein